MAHRARRAHAGSAVRLIPFRFRWSERSFLPIEDYTRTIATWPRTVTCQWCRRSVTQQHFPGPRPACCLEECKAEARCVQTRERVRRYRAHQQP